MNTKRRVDLHVRLYACLLRLYPEPFRSAYKDEMLLVFRDSCRAKARRGGPVVFVAFWLRALGDLLVNVAAEWLRQMTRIRWWIGLFQGIGGLAVFIVSNVLLSYMLVAMTVFFLSPWEITRPPAGTLAALINDFFLDSIHLILPILPVLLCEFLALRRSLRKEYVRLASLLWRQAGINLFSTLLASAGMAVGVWASSHLFPNIPFVANNPNYNSAALYWALGVLAGLILFYVYLAWSAPASPLWSRGRRARPTAM